MSDTSVGTVPPDGDLSVPPSGLLDGDFIHARRTDLNEPVEVAEGIVCATTEDSVTMGTRVFRPDEGWSFEIIRRPLSLPQDLTEIEAVLVDGVNKHLIGRGTFWTTLEGTTVSADLIKSFTLATA